jgi:hypothetical protein
MNASISDSANPQGSLQDVVGALVTHLILVAAHRSWSKDRLDSEMVRGIRTLCRRVRINTLTGQAERPDEKLCNSPTKTS